MATLTETAYYTRRTIKWGIIGLIAFFILRMFFGIIVSIWLQIFPPPPPPPTVAFGKLPSLKFPSQDEIISSSTKITYSLETIEGVPKISSSSATVFFIAKPSANLLSLDRANRFAAKMGFTVPPVSETASDYLWQDPTSSFRSLRMNIVTDNFKVNYDYPADLAVFSEKNLPTKDRAILESVNFMKNLDLYPPALSNGRTAITYWQLSGNNLVQTTSMYNADAIRVDFQREKVLNFRLFPSRPPKEPVYFLFSGTTNTSSRILEFSYKFWHIDAEQGATYPLKTAETAWQELKNGKGYIASIKQGVQAVTVRKIYLGYFYPDDYQDFLQPIFVFEGDPDFLAYVAAVSPEWTGR